MSCCRLIGGHNSRLIYRPRQFRQRTIPLQELSGEYSRIEATLIVCLSLASGSIAAGGCAAKSSNYPSTAGNISRGASSWLLRPSRFWCSRHKNAISCSRSEPVKSLSAAASYLNAIGLSRSTSLLPRAVRVIPRLRASPRIRFTRPSRSSAATTRDNVESRNSQDRQARSFAAARHAQV